MTKPLQGLAPFLVLAGVALMPREAANSRSGRSRPAASPRLEGEPAAARSTQDPRETSDESRGRHAEAPHEIPAKGWKDILIRSWKEFGEDQIPLISAGVTFYALLALFPALAAFVALYGLFADVKDVQRHLQGLSAVLPAEAVRFIGDQMTRIAAANPGGLSLALVGGFLLSIWSANGATKSIITALNIAYDETEKRSFVRKTAMSLAFTIAMLVFSLAALLTLGASGAIERYAGHQAATLFGWLSWPLLVAAMAVGLAVLYRFGPSRDAVKWRWISWGSAGAVLMWIVISAAFSLYVSNFGHYEKTYGTLGAVVGLMMWVYISAQVVLFGAELNSEIEHQTARDTTVGPAQPMGARGAVMADTVGAPQKLELGLRRR